MKKAMYVIAMVLFLAAFAMAQTYTSGSGITGVDKLGAHQNGGRGCTGCHAPHSGAFGAGGNAITGQTVDKTNAGNYALWGEDLGPLYGYVLNQGDNTTGSTNSFQTTLPASSQFASMPEEITGIMTCLSCHDGNIAKGAMMTNKSYEQAAGLLPTGVYGPNAIPTLLGNDGTTAGNYYNDHPVGPQATLGKVGVSSKLQYVVGGCGSSTKFDCLKSAGTDANFTAFLNHYGLPSITSNGHSSPVALPDTNPANAYLLCITCHTPHSMYVASANADAPIAGQASAKYPTYFFLAAPYNPGSNPSATQASSATQFCRQCHYSGAGGSNEASGILSVTTAF
jgi:hypothetical protein